MRKFLWVAIMAAAVTYTPGDSFAQRNDVRGSSRGSSRGDSSSGMNYQDISRRNTQRTDREARQKKEAEAAKKKAEEDKKKSERDDRMKRWREDRDKRDDRGNASKESASKAADSKSAKERKPSGPASAPVTTGGSYDPTTRQVTEVMLDAVKTQEVKFSRAEAADDPSIILLNPPRHNPEERKRATDFTGIGQPL